MRQFHDHNPIAVALYYLCVTGVTMFTMNPIILGLSLIAATLNVSLYANGGVRIHLFTVILFLILAIANPLLNHNGATVLFYLNERPVTAEAAIYGAVAGAMICAALYWLRDFSAAMTSDRLLYLFGRLTPKIALILSMAIRFAGLLRVRFQKIRQAQKALGLYDDGNLIDALRGNARVLSILITWTLENGIITAESMEARGYGTGRRTSFALYRIRPRDILLITACAALTALTLIGLTAASAEWYPVISLDLTRPLSIAGYAGFGLLAFLPAITYAKEATRWRSMNCAG